MSLSTWWRGFRYSAYDRCGNAKYLIGRDVDSSQSDIDGIPSGVRDEALAMLCHSFNIPKKQMYCLRLSDDLMAMYRSFTGPRNWDQLEFESLGLAMDALPGGGMSAEEQAAIKTVEDVIRCVAERRGIPRRTS